MSRTTRILFAAVVGLAVAAIVVLVTPLLDGVLVRPATCVETGCFCEAVGGGIPQQFFASVSSLVFVFLGAWALLPLTPRDTREYRLTPLFGVTLIFIGISSFIYHATLSFTGQFLDIFSMYTFGLLLALGALYRSGRLGGRASLVLFIALSVVFAVVQYQFPDARRILFAAILLPGLILELTPFIAGRRKPYLWAGIAILLLAYVIWILDQTSLCDPTSPVQGHAIWHALSAVAAFLIVLHYRATSHPRGRSRYGR